MNNTRTRGATAKFLALIASFTMILAGIAGVTLAGAASAGDVFDGNITTCPAGYDTVTLTLSDGWNTSDSATWTSSVEVSRIYVKAGNYYTFDDITPATSGSLNTDAIDAVKEGDSANISHAFGCAPQGESNEYCEDGVTEIVGGDDSVCESKEYCEDGVTEIVGGDDSVCESSAKVWVCHATESEKNPYQVVHVAESAWNEGTSSHSGHDDDFKLDWLSETDPADEDCGTPDVITTDYAYWCANGSEQSANRTVTNGTPGNWNREDVPAEYSEASGLSCTAPEKTCQELNNCPVNNPPSTPVVEAAVVSAPQAASVPETVAAPAAATVAAPAKVTVPQAATLPAAVPAGDGSQTPGMPMWAIALMAVGLIGAAFSAKGLLAARK